MRRHRSTTPVGSLVASLVALTLPASALANPWDISLRGLGRPDVDPEAATRFRNLTGELALALAPRPMQPAETLGVSGFEFSIANSLTDINEKADYWQGQPGTPIMEGPLRGRQVPSALWTPSVHVRKGLPFSTELGVHGTYLSFSELFMLGGELKIALHESYLRWMPALSARLAVGRLFGSSELDLLTAEADVMTSLPFGIGGMVQVTPYLGYGQLAAHVNSYVLDETPYNVTDGADQSGGPGGSLYNFETIEWHDNRYPRYFGGVRLNVAVLELLYEIDVAETNSNKRISTHTIKLGFDV